MHILVAGFQHETNTFAPTKADFDSFLRGEGRPALSRGAEIDALRHINVPIAGFIAQAEERGHSVEPVIWASASPSAHVTENAYERIAGEILEAIGRLSFDAIYLDLHGAMVAEHLDDGEGELLARIRRQVGPDIPVVASLDLHANVTERMLANADGLVAFRTYPHIDMEMTGRRAACLLDDVAATVGNLHRVSRRLPFLIPINAMCTLVEPAGGAVRSVERLETGSVVSMSFTPGFSAADFPECGPVVWGYGRDLVQTTHAVDTLYRQLLASESEWAVSFLSPDAAVKQAIALARDARGPVVIADTQDNPGAGGDSNTMGMLRALIENDTQGAAIGMIFDPAAARAAHRAGQGARLTLGLGGQSGVAGDTPLVADFFVEYLSAGRSVFEGPMMNGTVVEQGPVACLRLDDVLIAVGSSKVQMYDRSLYRTAGIVPESMKILVNKSSVHFRADFAPIASAILVAKAPGPVAADPADLPWRRLAPGMRTSPCGQAFKA